MHKIGRNENFFLINNNDTCPDDKGCKQDAFKIPSNVEGNSEKHHPNIDTPIQSPTIAFSHSFVFSNSLDFSKSAAFTFSNRFEKKTCEFSRSD